MADPSVQAAGGINNGTGSCTPPLPTGIVNGSLLLAGAGVLPSTTFGAAPTGYTAKIIVDGQSPSIALYFKRSGGTESAPTISYDALDNGGGMMLRVENEDTATDPFGPTTSATSAAGASQTPAVNLTGLPAGALGILVIAGAASRDITTVPTGWTRHSPAGIQRVHILSKQFPAGGDMGTPQATMSSTSTFVSGLTYIKPNMEGSISGGWEVGGAVTGERESSGSTSGAWDVAGSVTGERESRGAVVGGVEWAGSVQGSAEHSGSVADGWTVDGSVTGERESQGAIAGGWTVEGSVTGQHPPPEGSVAGGWDVAGAVTGEAEHYGSVAGGWEVGGAVTGEKEPVGAVAGGVEWAGAVTGEKDPVGAVAGGVEWSGEVQGSSPHGGSVSGGWEVGGSVTGLSDIPVVPRNPSGTIKANRARGGIKANRSRGSISQ